jgi:hypothetical protein
MSQVRNCGAPSPRHRLRRLLAHEPTFGRVVPEVAVGILQPDEVVGDAADAVQQHRVAGAGCRLRRRIQPLARMLAIPIAGKICVRVLWREERDRRAGLIDDEVR